MEQVPVLSAHLLTVVLRLAERDVMVVSVYVEGRSAEALTVRAIARPDQLLAQ